MATFSLTVGAEKARTEKRRLRLGPELERPHEAGHTHGSRHTQSWEFDAVFSA